MAILYVGPIACDFAWKIYPRFRLEKLAFCNSGVALLFMNVFLFPLCAGCKLQKYAEHSNWPGFRQWRRHPWIWCVPFILQYTGNVLHLPKSPWGFPWL